MFSLSQSSGYAILALSCMECRCEDRLVLARTISKGLGIPLPYLSKLLHHLVRAGLITSKRGYQGGFALSRAAGKIRMLDVVEAVEGPGWAPACFLGLDGCKSRRLCPTHDFWQEERGRIRRQLARLTLRDVARFERSARGHMRRDCCARPAPGAGKRGAGG